MTLLCFFMHEHGYIQLSVIKTIEHVILACFHVHHRDKSVALARALY